MPRRKLVVAHTGQLALGFLAAGHSDDLLENQVTDLLDGFGAIKNSPGVNIHVFDHVLEKRRMSGDFDARSRFAAIDTSSASRKNTDVAASSDQPGHAHGIETRRVHKTESRDFDLLGVIV